MQTANIILALAGDVGNTIPKYGVTAAEIAVLRAIHGDESVTDIEPLGEIERGNREELSRLKFTYGGAKDSNHNPIVEGLFPGVAARVFTTLAELELPDLFYKSIGRMTANTIVANTIVAKPVVQAPAPAPDPTDEVEPTVKDINPATGKKWTKKQLTERAAEIAARPPVVPPAAAPAASDGGDDGIGDMDDDVAEAAKNAKLFG